MFHQASSEKIILELSIQYELFSNKIIESTLFTSHQSTMKNDLFLLKKNYKNNSSIIAMIEKFTKKYPIFSEKNLTDLTSQKSLTNTQSRIFFFPSKPDESLPTKEGRSEKNYNKLR